MKSAKKLAISLCLFSTFAFTTSALVGNVDAAENTKDTHVYLKVNDYYVLYTTPKAPYLDQNNRVLIPLRSISELLGAEVGYNATTKIATIELENTIVTYQVDSKMVSIDGIKSTLDTKPVLFQNSIFIPLSSLIKSLKIKSEWNQIDKLYTLTGDKLMQTSKVRNWEELDNFTLLPVDNVNAFRPQSFRYDTSKNTVTIKSKNISGEDVAVGHEGVHPYFIFGESAQFDNKSRERSLVREGGIIETTWKLNTGVINGVPETLQYILVQGRSLK